MQPTTADLEGTAPDTSRVTQHDVVVVGAGQAGISLSYFLNSRSLDYVVLEREAPFSSWANRWEGFYANTPNWMNTLPRSGFKSFPGGDPKGFALKDELVAYFRGYLREVDPPLKAPCEVLRAEQQRDATWHLETNQGKFECRALVVCTGAMSSPRIPPLSKEIDASVGQLHSIDYNVPTDIETSKVLIVGSGSSGVQICKELCASKRFDEIHLATSNVLVLPDRILGVQIHRFLHTLGMFDVRVNSALGRLMYRNLEVKGDPIRPPTPEDLAGTEGVVLHQRLSRVQDRELYFEDGSTLSCDDLTVLWCTGYRGDYGWLVPAGEPLSLDERGYPVHERGVISGCPGLYFVGLRYQHTVASHDIYGVGQDARYIADRISHQLEHD